MDKYVLDRKSIDTYRQYLIFEECSPATIVQYTSDVQRLAEWLGPDKAFTKETLIQYKNYLLLNYTAVSVNCKISAVNSYLKYRNLHELTIKLVKLQKKVFTNCNKELSKDEYFSLISKAEEIGNKRLYYIMQCICSTGIRISELKYITVEAIKNGRCEINLKGKVRQILIPKKLGRKLLSYCKTMGILKGSVFVTRSGKPVNRSNIWKEMKNLCKLCGINASKVFPHNLRHLFAKTYYNKFKDIIKLSDILGHSNITTTRIYTISSGYEHEQTLSTLGLLT